MEQNVNREPGPEHTGLTALLGRHIPGARAVRQQLPGIEGMSLYLLNPDFPQHELTPEQFQAVLEYPAYWAFCWASGRVLAEYLLRHPQLVRGRRVLDFGCGSGVVGIAAARAGAREVTACDSDPDALAATRANAELNGVALRTQPYFFDCEGEFDLLLVADVLYDRDNLAWLERFRKCASVVLVADSRIRDFSQPGYERLGRWRSSTLPDLDESAEFRRVSVYAAGITSTIPADP